MTPRQARLHAATVTKTKQANKSQAKSKAKKPTFSGVLCPPQSSSFQKAVIELSGSFGDKTILHLPQAEHLPFRSAGILGIPEERRVFLVSLKLAIGTNLVSI